MPDADRHITAEERAELERARNDIDALTAAVDAALIRCVEAPATGSAIADCAVRSMEGWWLVCGMLAVNGSVDHLRALAATWSARSGIPPLAEPWAAMIDLKPAGDGWLANYVNVTQLIQALRGAALLLLNSAMCSVHELAGHDVEAWKREAVPHVRGSGQ